MHKKSIMLEEFSKYLDDIIYPTRKEKHQLWNISGVLKNRLNEHLKYDVRPMIKTPSGQGQKKGSTKSKADKIVFQDDYNWVIIDSTEIFQYIAQNNIKTLELKDLISELDWNIILPKY